MQSVTTLQQRLAQFSFHELGSPFKNPSRSNVAPQDVLECFKRVNCRQSAAHCAALR
jgi:hypothetical protein